MYGLFFHEDGRIAETSIGSMLLVTEADELVSPKVDGILPGTTIARAMELASQHLLGEGVLSGVSFRDLRLEDLQGAKEIISGGASMVYPIVRFDGNQVGNGQPGRVLSFLSFLSFLSYSSSSSHLVDLRSLACPHLDRLAVPRLGGGSQRL